VIHAFWIPDLRFKRDAFPGRHQAFDLRFGRRASFMAGRCAEFCGLKHSDMTFTVIVMPRADFDAWVAARRRAAR
jgi:cytochrome c oxidase subunit 2